MRIHSAFTLVELLVVVAIISVLAAMLLPTLSEGIAQAQLSSCSNNQRQVYMGISQYADSYGGRMCYGGDAYLRNYSGTKPYMRMGMLIKTGFLGQSLESAPITARPNMVFFDPGRTYHGSAYNDNNKGAASYWGPDVGTCDYMPGWGSLQMWAYNPAVNPLIPDYPTFEQFHLGWIRPMNNQDHSRPANRPKPLGLLACAREDSGGAWAPVGRVWHGALGDIAGASDVPHGGTDQYLKGINLTRYDGGCRMWGQGATPYASFNVGYPWGTPPYGQANYPPAGKYSGFWRYADTFLAGR